MNETPDKDKRIFLEEIKDYLIKTFDFEEYNLPIPAIVIVYNKIIHPRRQAVLCLTIFTPGRKFFLREDFIEDMWIFSSQKGNNTEIHSYYYISDISSSIKEDLLSKIISVL